MSDSAWTNAVVGDCLVPVPPAGKSKVQTRDYRPSGRFPVIDQGQRKIAGWTNDANAVIDSHLPLIVFGDHTRILKYVDFPFARGADGTQLLKPRAGIDPLFFYYACRAIDLPGRGYNRHLSILKEKSISYPVDEPEQAQIGRVLREIETAIDLETDLLALASKVKRLSMREAFSCGLRHHVKHETEIGLLPNSWAVAPFEEVFSIAQGQVNPTVEPYSSMLHIGPENVEADTGHLLPCQSARELGLISGKYEFAVGDIVYSKIRPYLNKVVMPSFGGLCSADMYPLRPRRGFHDRFLFHYLLSDFFLRQAIPHQTRTGIPKLNREQLASTKFPKPEIEEQREIAFILDTIDRKIELHREKRDVLQQLFKTVLHKLMMGGIKVSDLDVAAVEQRSEVVPA